MGVFFIAALFITKLNREWRVDALMERAGTGGPIVAGAAFAIAWTPCVGPTLGAILTSAANSGSPGRGAFLLAVYSAGLAIPFLLTALAFARMTTAFDVVKRHYAVIMAAGGVDPDRDGRPHLDRTRSGRSTATSSASSPRTGSTSSTTSERA